MGITSCGDDHGLYEQLEVSILHCWRNYFRDGISHNLLVDDSSLGDFLYSIYTNPPSILLVKVAMRRQLKLFKRWQVITERHHH